MKAMRKRYRRRRDPSALSPSPLSDRDGEVCWQLYSRSCGSAQWQDPRPLSLPEWFPQLHWISAVARCRHQETQGRSTHPQSSRNKSHPSHLCSAQNVRCFLRGRSIGLDVILSSQTNGWNNVTSIEAPRVARVLRSGVADIYLPALSGAIGSRIRRKYSIQAHLL